MADTNPSSDSYTRDFTELPEEMFDDGAPIETRPITPKQTAPVDTQKGLSRRVLWTIISIVLVCGSAIAFLISTSSSQTS
ncbi:MAG: hypothetical protein RIT51_1010 [Actinomycetota bacterium]|jgi:hypothetical protein